MACLYSQPDALSIAQVLWPLTDGLGKGRAAAGPFQWPCYNASCQGPGEMDAPAATYACTDTFLAED